MGPDSPDPLVYLMTKGRRRCTILGSCRCMVLFIPCECPLLLILLSVWERKECICQVSGCPISCSSRHHLRHSGMVWVLLSGAGATYITLPDLWSFCRGQMGELTTGRMWTKTYILYLLQGGTARSFSSLGYDMVSALLCWPRRG